jgi:hypothetical protein
LKGSNILIAEDELMRKTLPLGSSLLTLLLSLGFRQKILSLGQVRDAFSKHLDDLRKVADEGVSTSLPHLLLRSILKLIGTEKETRNKFSSC